MEQTVDLEIIIVSEDRKQAEYISAGLKVHGINVCACLTDIELVEDLCRRRQPLAVIVDEDQLRRAPAPTLAALASSAVVLLADPEQASDAVRKARIPIDALALRPIDTRHLAISIDLAMKNRIRLAKLAQDSAERRTELEQRKFVERAKGILMSKMDWDPIQAEDYLQKMADDARTSIGLAAKSIVDNPPAMETLAS